MSEDRCPTCGHGYLAPEVTKLRLKALEDDGARLELEEEIERLKQHVRSVIIEVFALGLDPLHPATVMATNAQSLLSE